ncbi:hypothetical protein ACE6H2_020170 [Prunus campanulata]
MIVVIDAVNGAVGHEDCRETNCDPYAPEELDIRYPFRLKGRQPIPCGFRGFDVSCTEHNEPILELPSSSAKLSVYEFNYRSHVIRGGPYDGCLPRELFYSTSNGSYPFELVSPATLFSCPPSRVRDEYCSKNSDLARLSHDNNSGNHIYAVLGDSCFIDNMPLVSCIKVHSYTSDPAYIHRGVTDDNYPPTLLLHWSVPSCEHCKGILHSKFTFQL